MCANNNNVILKYMMLTISNRKKKKKTPSISHDDIDKREVSEIYFFLIKEFCVKNTGRTQKWRRVCWGCPNLAKWFNTQLGQGPQATWYNIACDTLIIIVGVFFFLFIIMKSCLSSCCLCSWFFSSRILSSCWRNWMRL